MSHPRLTNGPPSQPSQSGQTIPRGLSRVHRCGRRRRAARRGITLLEIVLALALAAVAASLLSQLVFLGNNAAKQTRIQSRAQMIAQSVMAEAMAGIVVAGGEWELDPAWTYDLSFTQGPTPTVNVIRVEVLLDDESQFTLTQWQAIPPESTETSTGATAP